MINCRTFSWILFGLFGTSSLLAAQGGDEVSVRGEQVYRTSCATGYCHGPGGEMAGAPRLASRGFDSAYIKTVISQGIQKTPMPGFANTLPPQDMVAVMTYVARLNGINDPVFTQNGGGGAAASNPARKPLTAAAATGKSLFYDAVLGPARCSTCHEVEGLGIPVAAPITSIPASVNALRALATPRVRDVVLNGERMPALLLSNSASGTLFYDLTSAPPVLRTVQPGAAFEMMNSSSWSHSNFIKSYDEKALGVVLEFLKAANN